MHEFKADLHIHTCLSPCGDLEMIAPAIVERAQQLGLDAIGITDHNAAGNVKGVREAAKGKITVVGGMEITSQEEVHLLTFFDSDESLIEMQATVCQSLSGENDSDRFGEQVIVDEKGEPVDVCDKLLIGATTLSVEQIVRAAHDLNGLVIASHIDREAFGILAQLGFIPPELELDGLEVSRPDFKDCPAGYPVLAFSDAHFLKDIGRKSTTFFVEKMTVAEMRKALQNQDQRWVRAGYQRG